MSDSNDALRARRYRRHKRGDHSLCDPSRCATLRSERNAPVEVPADGMSVRDAVAAVVSELRFEPGDPRATGCVIALRLAEAFDANPTASIARELRYCMDTVTDHPNEQADTIDELRVRLAARRVDYLTAATGNGGGPR